LQGFFDGYKNFHAKELRLDISAYLLLYYKNLSILLEMEQFDAG